MADPELAKPETIVSPRDQRFQEGAIGDMGRTNSKLHTSPAEIARKRSMQVLEQPAALSTSKLELPGNLVDAIEQVSESNLAQADTVPASGPRRGSFKRNIPAGFMMPQPVRPVFPGLMKATESSLTEAEVRSTLSTSLAPRSGAVPSQPFRHNENTFTRVKSPQVWKSASNLRVTKTANGGAASQLTAKPTGVFNFNINVSPSPGPASSVTPGVSGSTLTSDSSTIVTASGRVDLDPSFTVNPSPEPGKAPALFSLPSMPTIPPPGNSSPGTISPFPARTPGSSSKKQQRSYMLPDGTVATSGKGLGRGRPGIKRGPRKSKLATEIKVESLKATDGTIEVALSPQKKRKTVSSDESADPATPSEPSSRASSEEFMPESTQTRSGRQALKPSTFVPSSTSTPVAKRARLSSAGPSIPRPAALAKIKRKTYRGREHAAQCEHCLRGHGPVGNVIVFCDACNKCWHQRCHEPQVSEAVIKDTKAEWYCNDCEKIINGPKKGGKKATPKSKPSLSLSLAPTLSIALVGASSLTREQREAQLSALSKDKLIEMLMRATDLAPALPLFENPNPPVVTTPTTSRLIDPYPTPTQEEDDYEYLYDEHAALYPRPGNGVKLPPESLDLAMLLEGPECKTFSHNLLGEAYRGLVAAAA